MTCLYGGPVRRGVRLRGGLGGFVGLGPSVANWLSQRAMMRLHLCSA
jgi:hypothetical protein